MMLQWWRCCDCVVHHPMCVLDSPLDTVNYCVRSWTASSCNCCKLPPDTNRSRSRRLTVDSLNAGLATVRWQELVILSISQSFSAPAATRQRCSASYAHRMLGSLSVLLYVLASIIYQKYLAISYDAIWLKMWNEGAVIAMKQ